MLHIIDSLISSCLEYGDPLFFGSPSTAFRILDTCYNAAIRLATALPSGPSAGVSSITTRLSFLTTFLIRLLLSLLGIRLGEINRSVLTTANLLWKWRVPLQDMSFTMGGSFMQLLRYLWPSPPRNLYLRIITRSLTFQDTSLPNNAAQPVAEW